MKTLDLRQQQITVEALLSLAASESVLILAKDGQEFILETANEFEQEIAALGQSEKFMSFLAERSQKKGCIPLAEIERKLQKAEE